MIKYLWLIILESFIAILYRQREENTFEVLALGRQTGVWWRVPIHIVLCPNVSSWSLLHWRLMIPALTVDTGPDHWDISPHQTILTMQHHAVVWTLQWSWLLITFILIIISFCSNNHCSSVLCWEGQPSTHHHLSSSTVLNILTFNQLDKQ